MSTRYFRLFYSVGGPTQRALADELTGERMQDGMERCQVSSLDKLVTVWIWFGSQFVLHLGIFDNVISPLVYRRVPFGRYMDNNPELSDRIKAAFTGCYEGPRAAALSGVPKSTVYHWARAGVVTPSVSQTRIMLWSYADLMALRIVYWLRHRKHIHEVDIPPSPMPRVREALSSLERRGIDIWDDSGEQPDSPLRVDLKGSIFVLEDRLTRRERDNQLVLHSILDLLGPFTFSRQSGPDLIRPRPHLRIIPGKVSGEPHLADSRITTQVAASLCEQIQDFDKVAGLYPGFHAYHFEEAFEFEHSLAA